MPTFFQMVVALKLAVQLQLAVVTPEQFPFTVCQIIFLIDLSLFLFLNSSVESIVNNRFRTLRCNSFEDATDGTCSAAGPLMGGEPSNNGLRGIFFLRTNANSPFGQG